MSLIQKLPELPCDMEYIRLRCREEDDCWIWPGAAKEGRWPVVCFRRIDVDGVKRDFILYVRHVVYWIRSGKRPSLSGGKTMGASCNNELCVNPAHVKMTTFSELQKRLTHQKTLQFRIKNATGRRKNSKLSDEAVREIRASELPRKELAAVHGVSYEYVRQLQNGLWRRDYTSPFAGLGV